MGSTNDLTEVAVSQLSLLLSAVILPVCNLHLAGSRDAMLTQFMKLCVPIKSLGFAL